jgi:hypothetical protein
VMTYLSSNIQDILIHPDAEVPLRLRLKKKSQLKEGCYLKVTPKYPGLVNFVDTPSEVVQAKKYKILMVSIANKSDKVIRVVNDKVFGTAMVVKLPIVIIGMYL